MPVNKTESVLSTSFIAQQFVNKIFEFLVKLKIFYFMTSSDLQCKSSVKTAVLTISSFSLFGLGADLYPVANRNILANFREI